MPGAAALKFRRLLKKRTGLLNPNPPAQSDAETSRTGQFQRITCHPIGGSAKPPLESSFGLASYSLEKAHEGNTLVGWKVTKLERSQGCIPQPSNNWRELSKEAQAGQLQE
ncbi:hypothetical protein DSO57_1035580 [Entomophthora muscae]|uniref:Uncharacterized protein n=1 Tax=Entomophthora muscae TaxID=34485 RepID=A0ACC2U9B5_9FUNG|nr:hypothetical protein DSO57_1035580 [Entomophthora muscae]